MNKYSILQTSKILDISKDTLRYYDKLGLVSPSRGENKYRYYTDQDILDLKYVESFKYTGFSLAEIRHFLDYMRNLSSKEECNKIEQLFVDKKTEYKQRIKTFSDMVSLIDKVLVVKNEMNSLKDINKANELVEEVFSDIKKEQK